MGARPARHYSGRDRLPPVAYTMAPLIEAARGGVFVLVTGTRSGLNASTAWPGSSHEQRLVGNARRGCPATESGALRRTARTLAVRVTLMHKPADR